MNEAARVLVIDDDGIDSRLTLLALEAVGIRDGVVALPGGEETLDYLYRRGEYAGVTRLQPVLVLLDLKMPRVDGFEVLAKVKTDEVLRVVPVVVLTSSLHEQDVTRAYSLGANGYVVKAMDFEEYVGVLKTVCDFWVDTNYTPSVCMGRGGGGFVDC